MIALLPSLLLALGAGFAAVPDSAPDNAADMDGDGVTTVEEFAEYASARLTDLDDDALANLAERVDTNDDGKISDDEFANRMQAIRGGADQGEDPEPAPAAASTVHGSWKLDVGSVPARLELRERGRGTRGTLYRTDASFNLRRIRVDGDSVTFQVGSDALTFEGTITGDTLEGNFRHPFGALACSGTRQDADLIQHSQAVAGAWAMETEMGEQPIEASMVLALDLDGRLQGTWNSMGQEMALQDVTFDGEALTFVREPREGLRIPFEAFLTDGLLDGAHDFDGQELVCRGERVPEPETRSPFTPPDPNVIPAWAKAEDDTTFFNELEAEFGERAFRAVGRDEFHVLDHPEMVAAADAEKVRDEDFVVGIAIGGQAKAYPVSPLDSSELANDTCGDIPIAASW